MPYGIYLSAEGAYAYMNQLEVITNNLANIETVGFKRELAITRARYAEEIEQGTAMAEFGTINDLGGGTLVQETLTDFAPGPLKDTGNRNDLALRDPSHFFVVGKGEETFLTRAGNFVVTAEGRLITQFGNQEYAVLDNQDQPIVVNPNDPTREFTNQGTIKQAGGEIALGIVRPESLGDLARVGQNVFRPLVPPIPVEPAERQVAVGFLEGSAVNPTLEMVELIKTSRAIEANINMMKIQDEMLSGLVNRVLRA